MAVDSSFCTVINCMDGRAQQPVIEFLQTHFKVPYVDSVTEPGPVAILAEQNDSALIASIRSRLEISVGKHKSVGIAVVAHDDCAGNPVGPDIQKEQLTRAVAFVQSQYPSLPTLGLWVDADWTVSQCV